MKKDYLFPLTLLLLIAFLQCNQTSEIDLKAQGTVTKISFTDQGCMNQTKIDSPLIKTGDALYSWKYENGVLFLDFSFTDICGSLFTDEVSINGSILKIVLTDTANGHARCICDFKESFTFSIVGTNQVHIIFSTKSYPDYQLTTLVDRVIHF